MVVGKGIDTNDPLKRTKGSLMELHQSMAFNSMDEDSVFMHSFRLRRSQEPPTRNILTISTLQLHRYLFFCAQPFHWFQFKNVLHFLSRAINDRIDDEIMAYAKTTKSKIKSKGKTGGNYSDVDKIKKKHVGGGGVITKHESLFK